MTGNDLTTMASLTVGKYHRKANVGAAVIKGSRDAANCESIILRDRK